MTLKISERQVSEKSRARKKMIARQKKEIEILKLEVKKLSSGQRAGNILGMNSKQTSQSRKNTQKLHTKTVPTNRLNLQRSN